MKKTNKTDLLIEEIYEDLRRIPEFIDGKKHKDVWLAMQQVFYVFLKLTKPVFLSDYQVSRIYTEVLNWLISIQLIADEGVYAMVVVYLNKMLMGYHERAMKLELYEAVSNIENYFRR